VLAPGLRPAPPARFRFDIWANTIVPASRVIGDGAFVCQSGAYAKTQWLSASITSGVRAETALNGPVD
jgi:hypothetical protein